MPCPSVLLSSLCVAAPLQRALFFLPFSVIPSVVEAPLLSESASRAVPNLPGIRGKTKRSRRWLEVRADVRCTSSNRPSGVLRLS